uniref:Carboxypeptidase A1 n=1 Tax=Hucho hucho TaxID=62062 RepID=A0A4W5R2G9_9TELE
MKGLLVLTALFVSVFGKETFEGDQVLRITARDEVQLTLLKDLSEMEYLQLDVWMETTDLSPSVDIRVPFTSLQTVKAFLETEDIEYFIMIKDLQVMLDEEKEQMLSAARATIYAFQDMLVAENPNLVSKIVIGQSYQGRPLNVLKVSSWPLWALSYN